MYCLMNKDIVLGTFEVVPMGKIEIATNLDTVEQVPNWLININDWIKGRSAAKHRSNIKDILRANNADRISGFIGLTRCLSLNDTLWVKDCGDNITWDEVSLYTNDFDDVISKILFDSNGNLGDIITTTYPEMTTDGTFAKCWKNIGNEIYLIKAGSEDGNNREVYNEVLASQFYSEFCSGVKYDLYSYDGKKTSRCKCFTSEKYGFRNASLSGLGKLSLLEMIDEYNKYDSEDIFRRMIVADSVMLNPDRHLGNFGFITDNDTFELMQIEYPFDYNMSLFPYVSCDESLNMLDKYIDATGTALKMSYQESFDMCINDSIKADLVNLKDLVLTVECDDVFPKQRLDIINRFKNVQIDRLLGNKKKFYFSDLLNRESCDSALSSLLNRVK